VGGPAPFLRVKFGFLSRRPFDQNLGAIKHRLIGESERQSLVSSGLFVDLDTIFIHRLSDFK
jgi:hypothetical protein